MKFYLQKLMKFSSFIKMNVKLFRQDTWHASNNLTNFKWTIKH